MRLRLIQDMAGTGNFERMSSTEEKAEQYGLGFFIHDSLVFNNLEPIG